MSKVKNQHFVSQFYLQNFTDSNGKIYAFDIISGKSFDTSTENIANQKYFYDYEPLDQFLGREQVIETALANSEGEQSKAFRKIVAGLNSNDLSSLTNEDYSKLADYIVTQQLRTPEARKKGIQMAKEAERQLRAKGASDDFIKEQSLEAEKYDPKFQQIFGLLHSGTLDIIEDVCNRYWVFWRNKTKHNFYTSDHPAVGYLHNDVAFEIYFPITPRYSVSIFVKNQFPSLVSKHQKIVEFFDPENVKFYNGLVVTHCNRQIYSAEDDFRLAKKIVKLTPALKDPNRQRIAQIEAI